MAALETEKLQHSGATMGAPGRGSVAIAANTRIWRGALVAINSDGRAIPAGLKSGGTVKVVGVASHTLNNLTGSELGGAAGAANVELEYGVYSFSNSEGGDEITAAHVGHPAYCVDDQTVARTADSAARAPAGTITEVRGGVVYLEVGPHVSATISGAPL